jgi:uncharacterized small protein (DUF1192 family)
VHLVTKKHKQTRRSVSLSNELYQDGVDFAAAHGISLAQAVARGLHAVIDGEVPLGPVMSSFDAGIATKRRRGIMPLIEPKSAPVVVMSREELDARCAARDAEILRREAERRALAAPPTAALSHHVAIEVSDPVASLVDDQLERAAADGVDVTDGEVFDGAINRMLDRLGLEAAAGALCANCLESDLCRCNGHRRAVGR